MKTLISRILNSPWYPLAFSAYPVLALLAVNAGQVQPLMGMRALIVTTVFGGSLFLVLWRLLRHFHKAAFLSTLLLALFFSYGHVFMAVDENFPDSHYTAWLGVVWITLFALSVYWVLRPNLQFYTLSAPLNTVGLVLLIMSAWTLSSNGDSRRAHALGADHAPVQRDLVLPTDPPDIYYFILDSYARGDLLELAYDYDNRDFLQALEKRGFYVAECSQSNYTRTELSMASSLNMMYLQYLDAEFEPDSIARRTLWNSLKHGAVRYNLESLGYQTVSFPTGYAWGELEDADLFITPPPFSSGVTEFEGLLLRTTLARHLQDWGMVDPDAVLGQHSRDLFNNVFDHIRTIAELPGPQFAYIHVISPHPPFVFDAQGRPTYPPDFWNEQRKYPYDLYARGYTDQTTYLNTRMLEAIDIILAESDVPPLIIIQGDHGPWMQPKDRHMWILNAYHLPGHADDLYPTISPVNSFRLVFNAYFGGDYEMLEDVSYYSPVPKLYEFSRIQNKCDD